MLGFFDEEEEEGEAEDEEEEKDDDFSLVPLTAAAVEVLKEMRKMRGRRNKRKLFILLTGFGCCCVGRSCLDIIYHLI